VGVVVTVLEAHFVGVPVRVRSIAMRVLVLDVIVLMRVVRMVVPLLPVRVLMIVGCAVFVLWIHLCPPVSSSTLLVLRSRREIERIIGSPCRHW
jgi:hypothetical protein